MPHARPRAPRRLLPVAILAPLALAACGAERREPLQTVRAEQFRAAGAEAIAPPTAADRPPETEEPPRGRVRLLADEDGAVEPFAVLTPEEAAEQFELDDEPQPGATVGVRRRAGAPAASGRQTLLVDAKVGDINGKAIYANSFLSPMAAELRTEAEVSYADDPAGWVSFARRRIHEALRRQLEEELVRAEAVASLDEQTRRFGLLEFTRRLRTQQQRRHRGSQRLFERAIKDQLGEEATLDDFLASRRDIEVSRMLIEREINRRVNISWREVVQEYERRDDDFRPPPRAIFRLIRVRSEDQDAVERIASALEAGEPFAEVAALPANGYRPERGGVFEASIEGDLPGAEVFRLENLNEAAVALRPGEQAGPIEDGSYLSWVRLERIEAEQVPLYDAQIAIERQRELEQRQEELGRFFKRLEERASFTGLGAMTDRLLRIAAQRYNPDALELLESRER